MTATTKPADDCARIGHTCTNPNHETPCTRPCSECARLERGNP